MSNFKIILMILMFIVIAFFITLLLEFEFINRFFIRRALVYLLVVIDLFFGLAVVRELFTTK